MSDVIQGYAQAIFDVAEAEGMLGDVQDEMTRFESILASNPALFDGLHDVAVPPVRRQSMIEELFTGKLHSQTVSLLSFVIGSGKARQLPEIISRLHKISAQTRDLVVAEVRAAAELTQVQQDEMTAALANITGKQIDLRVTIDPAVIGGAVVQVGDDIVDGTVSTKLDRLRDDLRRRPTA